MLWFGFQFWGRVCVHACVRACVCGLEKAMGWILQMVRNVYFPWPECFGNCPFMAPAFSDLHCLPPLLQAHLGVRDNKAALITPLQVEKMQETEKQTGRVAESLVTLVTAYLRLKSPNLCFSDPLNFNK